MGKFNEYTQKTTPADNDTMMIYDAAAKANKLSPFSGIWNWIVGKLTNAVISNLQTNNKSVVGALNELNSKALRYKNANVTDWNNVIEIGIYSGNNAANSPVSNAWINAICLSSNSNTKFLHLITFTTNGHIYLRNMLDGKWEAWNLIK